MVTNVTNLMLSTRSKNKLHRGICGIWGNCVGISLIFSGTPLNDCKYNLPKKLYRILEKTVLRIVTIKKSKISFKDRNFTVNIQTQKVYTNFFKVRT